MPRKRVFQEKKEPRVEKSDFNPRSYKSLIYGVTTVVIVFAVIMFVVRSFSDRTPGEISDEGVSVEENDSNDTGDDKTTSGEKSYTVSEGDNLWTISEKFFKSGYNWVDIASANKLSNPDVISKGVVLKIPDVSPKVVPTIQQPKGDKQTQVAATDKITGNSYTVKKGDHLWQVAVRAYGDGFKWVDIAKENKLENPDIIHSGNVLKLPR